MFLEQLTERPLDREVVQTCLLADLDGAHHVRVHDALAESRFPEKSGDGRAVVAELLAQDLQRDGTVRGMARPEHGRRATFADLTLERIPGYGPPDQTLTWHGANLIGALGEGN